MNCPFCSTPLTIKIYPQAGTQDPNLLSRYFHCPNEIGCWINIEFTRYSGMIDCDGELLNQEYALGPFYVKVYPDGTCIYKLEHCLLVDEVKVKKPLWLNLTNTDTTLDKLKMCVTFS